MDRPSRSELSLRGLDMRELEVVLRALPDRLAPRLHSEVTATDRPFYTVTLCDFSGGDLQALIDALTVHWTRGLTGVDRIAHERLRQRGEGYDAAHDAQHRSGELVDAALYCLAEFAPDPVSGELAWPWETEPPTQDTGEQSLVRAAALLAAELDRRAAEAGGS